MVDRPYAVIDEKGTTRFVLPRRARTSFHKALGWVLFATVIGAFLSLLYAVWWWLRLGMPLPESPVLKWAIIIVAVALYLSLKAAWNFVRGDQGEVHASVVGDFLVAAEQAGHLDPSDRMALTSIEAMQIADDHDPFAPQDNADLWAKRRDGTRKCVLHDYPRWLLEQLVCDLETMIQSAKDQPSDD